MHMCALAHPADRGILTQQTRRCDLAQRHDQLGLYQPNLGLQKIATGSGFCGMRLAITRGPGACGCAERGRYTVLQRSTAACKVYMCIQLYTSTAVYSLQR